MTMTASTTAPTNILEALNFAALEEAEQQELLLEISELVSKGTFIRLLERMDERTRDEFTALMERDATDEEVQAFIDVRVPDAQSAVTETVQELTNDILSLTKK